MKKQAALRVIYALAVIGLIAVGLISRKVAFIPSFVGDALWAAVVYCCFRFMLPLKRRALSAGLAVAVAYAVEFSQLITADWLVRLRSTFIGHMLLGQGFLWSDLAAYALGIAAAFSISAAVGRLTERRRSGKTE